MARSYSNSTQPTVLTSGVSDSVTTLPVASTAGFPTPPFTAAINLGTVNEEIILVEEMDANNFTVVQRGFDGTVAVAASAFDEIQHVVVALDLREAAEHIESGSSHLPPGAGPIPWPGDVSSLPTGWLLCDGSEVSRATYAALFAVIGTIYGSGNGSTTFNLPDMRGRAIVGLDDMGAAAAAGRTTAAVTLGLEGGAEAVTLSSTHLPSHAHVQDAHTHSTPNHTHQIEGSTNSAGSHFHSAPDWVIPGGASPWGFVMLSNDAAPRPSGGITGGRKFIWNTPYPGPFLPEGLYYSSRQAETAPGGSHSHSANVTVDESTIYPGNTVATNQATGGGGSHDNMPPFVATNYMIKA